MKYFNVKVKTTIVDEAKGKERKVTCQYLAAAEDATEAAKKTELYNKDSMYPTEIVGVTETKILEVIE